MVAVVSDAPSVDGADLKPISVLEHENEQRVERLKGIGVPEPIIHNVAVQVRIEAIVQTFPKNLQRAIDYRYELMLGPVLDDMHDNLTKPRLVVPE